MCVCMCGCASVCVIINIAICRTSGVEFIAYISLPKVLNACSFSLERRMPLLSSYHNWFPSSIDFLLYIITLLSDLSTSIAMPLVALTIKHMHGPCRHTDRVA